MNARSTDPFMFTRFCYKELPRPNISARLRGWIGKYPFDKVEGNAFLDDPLIAGQLKVFGTERETAIRRMQTVAPITEYNGWLVASGCQPHDCIDGDWTIAVNPETWKRGCALLIRTALNRFCASVGS